MSVEVLLLSRDLALLNVVRRVCDEAGISLKLATDAPEAEEMLARAKFDGVIADCDDVPSATTVVQNLRKGISNRSAIVFAIRNCVGISVRNAFELGANFVLDKPVNIERATRCVRAAQGLLVRERRRYFRVPAEIPVTLNFGDGNPVNATIANISEGGMSVRTAAPIPTRATVRFSFFLPDTKIKVEAKGEVAWSLSPNNRAGIHFVYLPESTQKELLMWINAELQRADPVLLLKANRGWAKTKEDAAF